MTDKLTMDERGVLVEEFFNAFFPTLTYSDMATADKTRWTIVMGKQPKIKFQVEAPITQEQIDHLMYIIKGYHE